jgi:beta-lactamase regulating signal transducer with metallopeptidase domain
MNAILDTTLNSVAMAIVHFTWQGVLVGLIAWTALARARNARPQTRYATACLGLLLCAALPIAQFMLRWSSEPLIEAMSSTAALAAGPAFYQVAEPAWYLQPTVLQPILPWILALWLAGVAVFSIRLLLGLQWVAKTRYSAVQLSDNRLQGLLDDLLPRMRMSRTVPLRLCPRIDTPMAMGLLRPLVLFPIGLAGRLSTDAVEALLAHELAHIKRHDYLINLLQRIVETLLFYHPVVWWLSRRIRQEREHIADDLAAQALGSPRRMALALTQLSDWQPGISLLANAAHGGNLMKRISRLIKPQYMAFGWKAALPALALALVCLTVVAKQGVTAFTANAASSSAIIAPGNDRSVETFAIVRAGTDGMMMSGSSGHIDDIKKARKQVDGDFMWFSRNGEAFVIRDPDVLSEVTAVWQPTEKLSAEMDALSAEMDVHSRKMDALSVEMDKSAALIEAPSKGMQELAGKREQLAGKYAEMALLRAKTRNESELATLDAREAALDTEQAALDNQQQLLESRLEESQAPMEKIGSRMEAAGKPMEALGKQMEVLGGRLEKSSQAADTQTRSIISEAAKQGKVQPLGKL